MKKAIVIGLVVLAGYTWAVHSIGWRHCATALEVVMISKLHLEERERTLLLHDVQAVKWPVVWWDLRGIWCAREARAEEEGKYQMVVDGCQPGYERARQDGPWPRFGCYPIGFDYAAANADIIEFHAGEAQAKEHQATWDCDSLSGEARWDCLNRVDREEERHRGMGIAIQSDEKPACSWRFRAVPFSESEAWSEKPENEGWEPYGNPIADTRNWKAGDLSIWIIFKKQECR